MKDVTEEIGAELLRLAQDCQALLPNSHPFPSVHFFMGTVTVDMSIGNESRSRICGRGKTLEAAFAQAREKLAEHDLRLLARTLGIEEAA